MNSGRVISTTSMGKGGGRKTPPLGSIHKWCQMICLGCMSIVVEIGVANLFLIIIKAQSKKTIYSKET